jgi:hypothetical protein
VLENGKLRKIPYIDQRRGKQQVAEENPVVSAPFTDSVGGFCKVQQVKWITLYKKTLN